MYERNKKYYAHVNVVLEVCKLMPYESFCSYERSPWEEIPSVYIYFQVEWIAKMVECKTKTIIIITVVIAIFEYSLSTQNSKNAGQ